MKKNVLIIGAGGVAQVVAHKCAQSNDILGDLHIASRTKAKCDAIIASVLKYADPVHKVSIISRGRAAGYTLKLPLDERKLQKVLDGDLSDDYADDPEDVLIAEQSTEAAASQAKS